MIEPFNTKHVDKEKADMNYFRDFETDVHTEECLENKKSNLRIKWIHHYHQAELTAQISLTLSLPLSLSLRLPLSSIAPDCSSKQHPVSVQKFLPVGQHWHVWV